MLDISDSPHEEREGGWEATGAAGHCSVLCLVKSKCPSSGNPSASALRDILSCVFPSRSCLKISDAPVMETSTRLGIEVQ